ncbi:CotY/CotZ family spore coat protein [Pseudalkalibacillus caeni]|uniref:Spore coat protein n=1 Tax=Exobacillus caeni TaxID=2574798 RepID=A0A5R9EXZ3_9BACL|nr:CotY/CotZ family spore coat protein [Pseudalkalibacillus caeni]TLS35359.1 hypothetical protein FCL54_20960 [Pseudalkalibacillus caeni]
MACGKGRSRTQQQQTGGNASVSSGSNNGCVCDVLTQVLAAQEETQAAGCTQGCFESIISPTEVGPETIPFMLKGKDNSLHFELGFPTDREGNITECFATIFFRINEVFDNCCATIELLAAYEGGDLVPLFGPGNSPTGNTTRAINIDPLCSSNQGAGFDTLVRTGVCAQVDLNCFCGVQCLSPQLVGTVSNGAAAARKSK